MKCPKCGYLGFDTGDRCRNCGYDFSLVTVPSVEEGPLLDLDLNLAHAAAPPVDVWKEGAGGPADASGERTTAMPAAPRREEEQALPLFTPTAAEHTEEPLLRFPAQPRPPLSVRRTPEAPRPRPPVRPSRRPAVRPEPVLEFGDDPGAADSLRTVAARGRASVAPVAAGHGTTSGPGRRVAAAAIDLAILFGIDLAVLYFTLRMAALSTADWQLLPPAPLLAFLVLLKLSYFFAFTAVGGQTIGKMALGIRVVADDDGWVDGSRALRRTVVGALSALVGGLGFLPALVGHDRRTLHDRVARTRVVLFRPL